MKEHTTRVYVFRKEDGSFVLTNQDGLHDQNLQMSAVYSDEFNITGKFTGTTTMSQSQLEEFKKERVSTR